MGQALKHVNGTFRNDNVSPLDNVIFVAVLMDDGELTPDSNRGDLAVQNCGTRQQHLQSRSREAAWVPLQVPAAILLAERQAYPPAGSRAGTAILAQASSWRARSRGLVSIPLF